MSKQDYGWQRFWCPRSGNNVTFPNADTRESANAKKGINWGLLLTVIGIIAGMMVSGAFNEEFRQWLNHLFSPQVEQESTPQAD